MENEKTSLEESLQDMPSEVLVDDDDDDQLPKELFDAEQEGTLKPAAESCSKNQPKKSRRIIFKCVYWLNLVVVLFWFIGITGLFCVHTKFIYKNKTTLKDVHDGNWHLETTTPLKNFRMVSFIFG